MTANTQWYKQLEGCLDVGIGKNGVWIVRNDNRIYYRDHSLTLAQSTSRSAGWQWVNGE